MASNEPLTIPVPLQTRDNRRTSERFVASMPVTVDGIEGTTTDLSPGGLSFVADRGYEPGARVDVVIEYLLDGHQYPLRCQAEVVRSEPLAQGWRIGARLLPESKRAELDVPAVVADAQRAHLRTVD